jgi:aspartyl-tRNA(Asn)/glutamyl-tRNA(Gln) amidotransferase subunit B
MYESVIGLEVHLAVSTASKLFCSCSADSFGAQPNTHTCPVCLGLPGTLPVANAAAVEKAIMFSLALGCSVPPATRFQRKHYFYPDAPKSYQTSQAELPFGEHGSITLGDRQIGITRCHLEEDAGRSVHPAYKDYSLIDLNRAGAALIEMVTEPDLRTPAETREFLFKVRAMAQALGVSDASPEEGKMRADVNVSLRRPGEPLGVKVELKNLNSFRSVQSALEFEIKRQAALLDAGKAVQQQTRGWNEGGQRTYLMREKEGEADYRYLIDPDLPAIHISDAWLADIRQRTRELPDSKLQRYQAAGVREADAQLIAFDTALAAFFDAALAEAATAGRGSAQAAGSGLAQNLANWLNSDVSGLLNAQGVTLAASGLTPANLLALVTLVTDGSISGRTAKDLLPEVLQGADSRQLVEARGLLVISDDAAVRELVAKVVQANAGLVDKVRQNPNAINALLGLVMRESRGQANPELVRTILQEQLGL